MNITEAIQVAYELTATNFHREISGLTEAMQSYNIPKGTLIVFDDKAYRGELPEGISIVPAYAWLIAKK